MAKGVVLSEAAIRRLTEIQMGWVKIAKGIPTSLAGVFIEANLPTLDSGHGLSLVICRWPLTS